MSDTETPGTYDVTIHYPKGIVTTPPYRVPAMSAVEAVAWVLQIECVTAEELAAAGGRVETHLVNAS